MNSKIQSVIQEKKLLKVIVQIHHWESLQQSEFQTRSGRDLYFRMAENFLALHEKPLQLKWLNGSMSERTTRNRRQKFQSAGFIDVANAGLDLRTRQAVPTEQFIAQLNLHLQMLRTMLSEDFVLIEKI